MSGFPARPRWAPVFPGVAVLLVLAGGWGLTATALGQEEAADTLGQPLTLAPPTALLPGSDQGPGNDPEPRKTTAPQLIAPTNAAGFAPAKGSSEEFSPARPRLGIQGMEINRLGEIDPDSIGILGPESGGFRADMWRGSSRKSVERLLPRLPSDMTSGAMRSLAQRLLLTNATPPRRRGPDSGSDDPSLLALRVDRLVTLGDIESLNGLLKAVPQRVDDETIGRARVEGLLLDGDNDSACQKVLAEIAEQHDKSYWRKALVFCQIHAGQIDQAMLGVGLMREEGLSDDPAFFSLVEAYGGAELTQVAVASPLHLAMLDVAGVPVPDSLLEDASPGIIVALAKSPKVDLVQRALAGERAVSRGLLPAKILAEIYQSFTFEPDSLETALGVALEADGPNGRALLYQAARASEQPSARADLLRVFLERADMSGSYQTAVRVLLPMLAKMPVEPGLVWFADTAGRALYATGRFRRAASWLTLARQEAIINPQAAAAVTSLWPYSRLAGSPSLAWGGNLEVWRAARAQESGNERGQLALLRSAFMALGENDTMDWIDLATETGDVPQPAPNAALLYALDHASNMRRVGETVLLSLLVLGEEGPAQCHPIAFNAVLRAMREIGLEREARELAIEAAIAKGI